MRKRVARPLPTPAMSPGASIDTMRQFYQQRDEAFWKELERLITEAKLPLSEVLINYPAFIRRREMTRLLADYDLFRMIVTLPGSIVELGVYLGAGILTWAKLLETFVPGDRSRKVYGFEHGAGYRDLSPEDGRPQPWIDQVVGRKNVPAGFLAGLVALANSDNLVPGLERCRVIEGDIAETVPTFARNAQGTRLAMLFFDVNLYAPTLVGLRELYPLLVPGGVVALNGFGAPPWQGETQAFEEYFREIGQPPPPLQKFTYSIHPGGYFLKP